MLHEIELLHRSCWSRYERESIATNITTSTTIGLLVYTMIKMNYFVKYYDYIII